MMKPPQETAFVADVAAPAAVQSTRARWLAAVCSTAALPAPKARRSHVCLDLSQRRLARLSASSLRGPCSSPRTPVILRRHGAQRCYVNTALPFVAQPQRPTYLTERGRQPSIDGEGPGEDHGELVRPAARALAHGIDPIDLSSPKRAP